jgi:hypothetical protein
VGAEVGGPDLLRSVPIGSSYISAPPRQPPSEPEPTSAVLEPLSAEPPRSSRGRPRTKSEHALSLARALGEVSAGTLQDALEVGRDAAHQILSRLAKAGQLRRLEPGRYAPVDGAKR